MKTAISIPDQTFQAGETLAKHLGVSRSELYTKALQAFIATHNTQHITEAVNQIYAQQPSAIDPLVAQMQFASLPREDW